MEYAEEKEFTSFEEETTSASDAEESRMLNSLDAGTDGLETSPPRSLLGLEQLRDRARMHVQEVSRPLFQNATCFRIEYRRLMFFVTFSTLDTCSIFGPYRLDASWPTWKR